jgi:hypothetical protein
MFFDWYALGDVPNSPGGNAWNSFAVIDVFLGLASAMGIALFVAAASQRSPAVAQAVAAITVLAAGVATVLVLIRLFDPPSWQSVVGTPARHAAPGNFHVTRGLGLYLGIAATFGVLFAAWRSMGDERFPRAARPEVDVTPLPAPKARTDPDDD